MTMRSSGMPSRSYMPSAKPGAMATSMSSIASVLPSRSLVRKNSGTPTAADAPMHTSWRFVSPSATLDLMRLRSLGTVT